MADYARINREAKAAKLNGLSAPEPEPKPKSTPTKETLSDIWAKLQAATPEESEKQGLPSFEELESGQASPEEVPWERLDHYGFLPGLALTLKKILFKPVDFFEGMPENQGLSKALVFNLILMELLQAFLLLWVLFGVSGPEISEIFRFFSGSTFKILLMQLGLLPGLGLAVLAASAIVHGLLTLFKSVQRPFEDTFRTVCYAAAPLVFVASPVLGPYLLPVAVIWCMTLQAIGFNKVHKAAYMQSLAAVLLEFSVVGGPLFFLYLHWNIR